jgi:hypothetical protein
MKQVCSFSSWLMINVVGGSSGFSLQTPKNCRKKQCVLHLQSVFGFAVGLFQQISQ